MTTQTHTYWKTEIPVGVMYIVATAVSLLNTALTHGALDAPDNLTRVAAQAPAELGLAGGGS